MWDDEINNKLKDAADQYHPSYDDNAWDKMELMLNKHLPIEKKRKKRFLYIFLIALLAGVSTFLVYDKQLHSVISNAGKILPINNNTVSKNKASLIQLQKGKIAFSNIKAGNELPASSDTNNPVKSTSDLESDILKNRIVSKSTKNIIDKDVYNTNIPKSVNKVFLAKRKVNASIINGSTKNDNDNGIDTNTTADKSEESNIKESNELAANIGSENENGDKEIIRITKNDTIAGKEIIKTADKKETIPGKKTEKINKGFNNNFAISFSAGPDVSGVRISNTGKVSVNYGIGLRYSLAKRITLQSGFYISEKIYSAGKNDYHDQYSNSNYLYNINANCKVYELPLTISYTISESGNHKWLASAGLSSYLMKKESYDYNYKYPNGYAYTKSSSISNQNQHYFSVLDLSAGYQHSFSKRTSFLAEPYLKIPLSGIGAGKVKLNSAGMFFTFVLKPFTKK